MKEATERIKAMADFCRKAEKKLDDLAFSAGSELDDMKLEYDFFSQVKSIKNLCEKAMQAWPKTE